MARANRSGIASSDESMKIMERALGAASAREAVVDLGSYWSALTRFAANTITQNVCRQAQTLALEVTSAGRSGVASTTSTTHSSLRDLARSAEEAARYAPRDPEHRSPLGLQTYSSPRSFVGSEDWRDPEERCQAVAQIIKEGKKRGVTVSGGISLTRTSTAMATSKGLRAYSRRSKAWCSVTALKEDGSGWSEQITTDPALLDPRTVVEQAIERTLATRSPKEIEPGEYPVILSSEAVSALLAHVLWHFSARSADEKRSFFSRKMNRKVAASCISLRSDPCSSLAPGETFNDEGIPAQPCSWIEKGVLRNLVQTRYWAYKQGIRRFTFPSNLLMDGAEASEEDLIRGMKRGIYVSRLWYIRLVEPMSLTLTGITRDGTFWVEDGKIHHPVRNMRFNDSPMNLLKKTVALGCPKRVAGPIPCLIPPLRAKSFKFTSVATK